MNMTKSILPIFLLLACVSEISQAQDGGGRGTDPQVGPRTVQQTNDTIPSAQFPGDAQNYIPVPQDAPQDQVQGQGPQGQGQVPYQGQEGQVPYYPGQPQNDPEQQGQIPMQGQGQQEPVPMQGTQGQAPMPGQGEQGQTRMQNQPGQVPLQDQGQQGQTRTPNQGQQSGQGQTQRPAASQNNPDLGQAQDQLPPEAPQVRPLPKKPKVFPKPTPIPRPSPQFTPAPAPEPTTRPQPSGPKTAEQKAYESAMQARWKAAADEIALLRSRGESLQGKKGKAFRESLRTASGNRSMARTKLSQLVRGSSADFDKFKSGVEKAFADLDTSIERVRSYFDEPPSP